LAGQKRFWQVQTTVWSVNYPKTRQKSAGGFLDKSIIDGPHGMWTGVKKQNSLVINQFLYRPKVFEPAQNIFG
jgi:hypothetical protein